MVIHLHFDVARRARSQLLKHSLRFGHKGVAEFRVFEASPLLFIKAFEKKLDVQVIELRSNVALDGKLQLVAVDLTAAAQVNHPKGIDSVELLALTHQPLS